MAASEPKLQAKGADYGTGRKGSIEWQGSDLYWNQYGIYSDGKEPVFARVLKTGQTQPVSSGEYGDLRFSGSDVYKLGQAGTSLKTASATAAADDRPGYLPGQPWRASGSGPQLSYRRKGIRQYELTDHLGNVRAVIGDRLKTDNTSTVTAYKPDILSATDYFPFGMQMPGRVVSGSEYRYGFNGMEKDDAEGNRYTTLFRLNDVRTGRWLSVDPKTTSLPWQSPYCSMDNNPIWFNDPQGDKVHISGTNTTDAFNQLQASARGELNLSIADGILCYSLIEGANLSIGSRQLLEVIDSETITVNLSANNSKFSSTDDLYEGGAFMGNKFGTDEQAGTIQAYQEVNPQVLGLMSVTNANPGADMLHEVTEAYQGALISKETGVPSPASNKPGTIYEQAHDAATPQSSEIFLTRYDSEGNVLKVGEGTADRAEWSVKSPLMPSAGSSESGPSTIIMTIP